MAGPHVEPGHVYVLTHPAHAGFVKIGRTKHLPSRLSTYQVGCPRRAYRYEHTEATDYPREVEWFAQQFAGDPIGNSEWFRVTVAEAVVCVRRAGQLVGGPCLHPGDGAFPLTHYLAP